MTTTPTSNPSDCPADEVVRDYVAGLLTEAEAEELERHYFACDRCHAQVRRALELRSSFDGWDAASPPGRGRQWRAPLLLAAAGLAALAVGVTVWMSGPSAPGAEGERVLRGEVAELAVEVRPSRDGFELEWRPAEGTERYRVSLFSPTGALYEEHDTEDDSILLQVPPRVGEPIETARRWVVRVEGLDVAMRVVVRSRLIPVTVDEPP